MPFNVLSQELPISEGAAGQEGALKADHRQMIVLRITECQSWWGLEGRSPGALKYMLPHLHVLRSIFIPSLAWALQENHR